MGTLPVFSLLFKALVKSMGHQGFDPLPCGFCDVYVYTRQFVCKIDLVIDAFISLALAVLLDT